MTDSRPPHSVLLVDDEDDLRDVLRLRLEADGRFEIVGESNNGQQALDLAEQLEPDVIILDLLMPGLDGRDVLPSLVAMVPSSMIVVFSAVPSSKAEQQTTALGAFAYLEKTEIRNIADRLDTWLEQFHRVLDGEDMIAPVQQRANGSA